MQSLPILKYKKKIQNALKKNNLIIIRGETGCGKTTQIPQIIYKHFLIKDTKDGKDKTDRENKNKKETSKRILISLPRRVATITVAERVAKEMNTGPVGNYVGYSIRFKNVCSKLTKIKFVTDGILLREIINDPLLKKYKFLILDEIHERSIRTDILLGYVKILLEKRKSLKVILMSATLDIETFQTFFNNPKIIYIPHKLHKITIYYPTKSIEDYLVTVTCTILQIHFGNSYVKHEELSFYNDFEAVEEFPQETKEPDKQKEKDDQECALGDILVFLPGQEEIEMVNALLNEKLKIIYKGKLLSKLINQNEQTENSVMDTCKHAFSKEHETIKDISFHFGTTEVIPDRIYNLKILQLYSSLPQEKQQIIFNPVPPNTRKVILSTNIAETSVTIPNIRYVIDSGKAKIKYFDIKKGSSVLKVSQISKDAAMQRSGRAGRTFEGKVFRIYTQQEYEQMNTYLIPEIFRSDLTQIYLELKAMNISNPLEFQFPENPKKELFIHAAKMLYRINAIDVNNNLTESGKKMCLFPLNPIYANMLLCSIEFDCVNEVTTLVSLLNCDSIFINYNFYEDQNIHVQKQDASEKTGNPKKNHTEEKDQEESSSQKINDKNILINMARRKLIHPNGDHLTLLHIFYLWKEFSVIKERKNFCHTYGLKNEVLMQAERIQLQLLEIMKNKLKVNISNKLHMHQWDNILICLCKSCFFNVAKLSHTSNVYTNLVNKTKVRIHPSSTLFNSFLKPEFIFYSDLVQTNKLYARIVTKIEYEWLLKYLPQKFQMKKK